MSIRTQLIQRIFGQATLPETLPTVSPATTTPGIDVSSYSAIEKLTTATSVGNNYAYLHRTSEPSVNRLAIVHQGHGPSQALDMGALGVSETAEALLSAGFDVICAGMPGYDGNQGSSQHNSYESSIGLSPFLLHVVAALNLLADDYDDVFMTGISGGGWTTTIAAAIDTRIKRSAPVAGSLPWHLRTGTAGSLGDWEQIAPTSIVDYPGIYALGCLEEGRHQRQILNRNDDSSFARDSLIHGAYGLTYEVDVVQVVNSVVSVTGGRFDWFENVNAITHEIHADSIAAILDMLGIEPPEPPPGTSSLSESFAGDGSQLGADLTWTHAGNWKRVGGHAERSNSTDAVSARVARVAAELESTSHYAEIVISSLTGNGNEGHAGVIVSSNTTTTKAIIAAVSTDGKVSVAKLQNGVWSHINDTYGQAESRTYPMTFRADLVDHGDGTCTVTARVDGVIVRQETTTTIGSNLGVGIYGRSRNNAKPRIASFEAGVL